MDASRFDHFTRSLTQTGSRRHALAALGGVFGGVLGASVIDEAAKKKCPPCKKSKQGKCKKKLPNGTACSGGTCQNGSCVANQTSVSPPPSSASPPPSPSCAETCAGCCDRDGACGACLVFLTSETRSGDLGGLNGADAICQRLANDAATPLPGSYKAWLSTGNGPGGAPATRFRRSQQPYQLVTGTKIADNWDDLTTCDGPNDHCLDNPIDRTEDEILVASSLVWTHTLSDGTAGGGTPDTDFDCKRWLATVGESGDTGAHIATNETWTTYAIVSCSDSRQHLYCFQQS